VSRDTPGVPPQNCGHSKEAAQPGLSSFDFLTAGEGSRLVPIVVLVVTGMGPTDNRRQIAVTMTSTPGHLGGDGRRAQAAGTAAHATGHPVHPKLQQRPGMIKISGVRERARS
jgi:hypothetical protein